MEPELQRQRYETFIKNSSEGIWRIEFTEPISLTQEKTEIAKQIAERGIIAECNQALAQMYGFQSPAELCREDIHSNSSQTWTRILPRK